MNREKRPVLFVMFYIAAAVGISALSVWEIFNRNGKVSVITFADTKEYILLAAAAAVIAVCAVHVYRRGNAVMRSVTVRKSIPCGVCAAASSAGFLVQAYNHFSSLRTVGDHILFVLSILSAAFLAFVTVVHFLGGMEGIGNLVLIGSLMPLLYFLVRLVLLYFSEASFYPTVDNVLEQLIMTVLLLFFLGFAKDIWMSGAEYGCKLMAFCGLFLPILSLIRIVTPLFVTLVTGTEAAGVDLLQMLLYLLLTLYALADSIHILSHSI